MKVIIYGLGREGILVKELLRKEHKIEGYTDSFANIHTYMGYKFYCPVEIVQLDFDYIIIALSNKKNADKAINDLEAIGVRKYKIIDFMQIVTDQKVDKVMEASYSKIDGLILGNSHAALGINPRYLNGICKNLANGSEDIFYRYKVFEKIKNKYDSLIDHLKYVIIELYDYTIFNYDVSLSKMITFYWSHGGFIEDLHNFNKNINFSKTLQEQMKFEGYYLPVSSEQKSLRQEIFHEEKIYNLIEELFCDKEPVYLGFNDFPLESQFSKSICKQPSLPYNMHFMGEGRYKGTIEENIFYLHRLIRDIRDVNSSARIILLLMPRYTIMEHYHKTILGDYKEEYGELISKFTQEYKIEHFDLKDETNISNNPHFYKDTAHLNFYGSIAFTSMLRDKLKIEL